MQGQMECCNLEECDFLQVKIEEYDNEEEYINDEYIYNGVLKDIIYQKEVIYIPNYV